MHPFEAMTLSELTEHIEQTHHAYLRKTLPRLVALSSRVETVHARRDSRLREVCEGITSLSEDFIAHLMKEEKILFPMIRQLEKSDSFPELHCGTLGHPIRQMEYEHEAAGFVLDRLRELTDHYIPPPWACDHYRELLESLLALERDLDEHVRKENDLLFPKAMKLEREKRDHFLAGVEAV